MSIYGECINHLGLEATHAVTFKDGCFGPANDRFGVDKMTVALGDIVFCEECAGTVAALANATVSATQARCDTCGGSAMFRVRGRTGGNKCIGHVEKYRRGRTAAFYEVERIPDEDDLGSDRLAAPLSSTYSLDQKAPRDRTDV